MTAFDTADHSFLGFQDLTLLGFLRTHVLSFDGSPRAQSLVLFSSISVLTPSVISPNVMTLGWHLDVCLYPDLSPWRSRLSYPAVYWASPPPQRRQHLDLELPFHFTLVSIFLQHSAPANKLYNLFIYCVHCLSSLFSTRQRSVSLVPIHIPKH